MDYEDRYVLFIDILGFKRAIEESLSNRKVFDDVVGALQTVAGFQGNAVVPRMATAFSDCIVVSYSRATSLLNISIDIMHMQQEFISRTEMLLRGGVTFGKIVHSRGMVFGPALVRAVELEKDHAKNPRIVLDECISETIEKAPGLGLTRLCGNPSVNLKDPGDAFYYCNYLNCATPAVLSGLHAKTQQKIATLQANSTEKGIVAKWQWYQQYVERCMRA